MAGWSILTNGSALDCGKTIGNGCCSQVDHDVKDSEEVSVDCKDELKCLFDQVLSTVLGKVDGRGCIRPIPAMLGDGRSLDLFKLFCVVGERGGSHMVSKNGLWGFVVRELGLDLSVLASVKLIYAKYLGVFEKCLMGSCGFMGSGGCDCGGKFGLLPLELEREFKCLVMSWPNKKFKGEFSSEKSELDMLDKKNRNARCNDVGKRLSDDDENVHGHDDKLCDSDPTVIQKESFYLKRKRESLSGMLNWVIRIAKHPDDPSIAIIPEPSRLKEYGDEELWVQAIRARDALLQRRHVDLNIRQSLLQLQNGQKMHPSMYEDITDQSHRTTERLRYSERLSTVVKSRLCSCHSSCSAAENKLTSICKTEFETGPKNETLVTVFSAATNATNCSSGDVPREKDVRIGPLFQAIVPEWTVVVVESDSKWLGTRVWPLAEGEPNLNLIGRGRPDACGCRLPGSVECVRFHIAEKRMKLKHELGPVFYHWRFDRMGEEVSLQWTVEEEKIFKDMIKLNRSSQSVRFKGNASKCFLKKTREELLSYYFNVFLVYRRRYQNRVTPKDIDSDDDESEFGSVGDGFRHEAVKVRGSNKMPCIENTQCNDLDFGVDSNAGHQGTAFLRNCINQ